MSKTPSAIYPGYNKPNNQDIMNGSKQCSKCHGTGKNTPIMMVPIFQHMYPNDNNNKHPQKLFMCDNCNGTGKVPFIKPIICTK